MKGALLVSAVLSMAVTSAFSQDPGLMAVQQANQIAMQSASLQAAQQMQQDMMAAGQAAAQAMQMNQQMNQQFNQQMLLNNANGCEIGPVKFYGTWLPQFSKKSGLVKAGTVVRIKWRGSDFAWVYYSTDGWTPTTESTPYEGPIVIDGPTHLQAIAAAPGLAPSRVFDAYYDVASPTAPAQPASLSTDGVLRAGASLQLRTDSTVDSRTAHLGDQVALMLDMDVKVGDNVVIARGTPVNAVLTQVTPASGDHNSGKLVFEIQSLNLHGKSIPLHGGETLEAVIGSGPKEAVIEPGMTVHVKVAADARLKQ